jgi:hypothetical protein
VKNTIIIGCIMNAMLKLKSMKVFKEIEAPRFLLHTRWVYEIHDATVLTTRLGEFNSRSRPRAKRKITTPPGNLTSVLQSVD